MKGASAKDMGKLISFIFHTQADPVRLIKSIASNIGAESSEIQKSYKKYKYKY